jgi:hypothetical protein
VRELFPADHIGAQWVFALTAATQDIIAADRGLRDALEEGVDFRSAYCRSRSA